MSSYEAHSHSDSTGDLDGNMESCIAPVNVLLRQTRKNDTETQDDMAIWSFPSPEAIREELAQEFTPEQKEKAWTEAAEAVKASYDLLLGRWKEEMDTLLVYAGVSSAVLTAFNVESYQLLPPDPSDATLAALKLISAQLNGYTLSPPFLNATYVTESGNLTQAPFQAPGSAVWLNVLWFCSLVSSVASALLVLFIKQWLYEAMIGGTSRQNARLRQYRLNGLVKWRVGMLVLVPSILLQLASVLFLSGLLVLLWTLNSVVAAVTSFLVASFFTFFLGVTILPVFKSDCSFRSPASYAIYVILTFVRNEALRVIRRICKQVYRLSMQGAALIDVRRAHFDRLGNFAYTVNNHIPTWRGRDQNEIFESHSNLDRAIVTTAYSSTADTKFLFSMPVVFSDLASDQVAMCFADILGFMEAEWGEWHLPEKVLLDDPISLPLCAVYGIRHMLARSERGTSGWFDDVHVILRHYTVGVKITDKLAELACKTLCQLAVEDREYRFAFGAAYTTLKKMYHEQGAHHTYETLLHARAMYEVSVAGWDPSAGFLSFRDTTQAIWVLLHCIRATIDGCSQLTPSQTDAMLVWGKRQLFRLQQWLRGLEWTGLHKGCLAISGDGAAILAFPHIASHLLVMNVIDPVIALGSIPGGRELVTSDLVFAIEQAWSRARLAYPDFAPRDAGFVWSSGLEGIDSRLAELCAVL